MVIAFAMIENHYQSPLAQNIQKEYNKLITLISHISPQDHLLKKIEGTGVNISIADLIAYHIGWGTLLCNWYQTGIKGQLPQMPGDGFTKWDYVGLARHFYEKYHYDGGNKQLHAFAVLMQNIIAIVKHEYKTGNLDKIGVWDWCTLQSGKKWPLSKWIIVNTVSPYKKSYTMIRKFKKELDVQRMNV